METVTATPALVRSATRQARSRVFDSAAWKLYRPRPDDIIISTYPKCGTTWTQRIVSMLIAGNAEPAPIDSPWFDMRLFGPPEIALGLAEAQTTRRYLKSHLPYDALPVYEGVKFIHVARDGRDSAMSFHNHLRYFLPQAWEMMGAVVRSDPKFSGEDLPVVSADPAAYFGDWLADGGGAMGDAGCGYFHMENSYWAARRDPNMLLVHYADLKADPEGEIRRIAGFLGIELPEAVWPDVVAAADIKSMKANGEVIVPFAQNMWDGGAQRFINKGVNGRWQGVFGVDDLARYAAMVKTQLSPALAGWLEHGRLVAGDPAEAPD
jgi:aryl sulfotransferase